MSFSNPSVRDGLKQMEFGAAAMSSELAPHTLRYLGCISQQLRVGKLIQQEKKTSREGQIYRFFSLLSLPVAFLLLKGGMP